jgi:hypothetical protein
MSVRKTDTWFNTPAENESREGYRWNYMKNPVCIAGQDYAYTYEALLRHIIENGGGGKFQRKTVFPDPRIRGETFNVNDVVAVETPGRPRGEYEETWKLLKDNVWTKAPSTEVGRRIKEHLNPNFWKGKAFAGRSPLKILVDNGKRIVACHDDSTFKYLFFPYTGPPQDKRWDLPYRWTDDMTEKTRKIFMAPYSVSSDGLDVRFNDRLLPQFMEALANILKTDLTIIESNNTRSIDYLSPHIPANDAIGSAHDDVRRHTPNYRYF